MIGSIRVDLSEFESVMPAYVVAKKSNLARELTRQVGQLALCAGFNAPMGNKNSVYQLPYRTSSRAGRKDPKNRTGGNTQWWPAFIQKILSNGGFSLRLRRKATAKEAAQGYTDPATGKHYSTRKTVGYSRLLTNKHFGNAANRRSGDLQAMSKRILDRRNSTFGWMRAVFGRIATDFGVKVGKLEGRKNSGKFWATKEATPDNLSAGFILPFESHRYAKDWPGGTRPSQMATALGKQAMAIEALETGRDQVIEDMRDEIVKRAGFDNVKEYAAA